MSKRKINLEEILQDYYLTTLDNRKEIHAPIEDVKSAMIEFGKQLLELAAENVSLIEEWGRDGSKYPEDTITIYDEYDNIDRIIYPDKQSILDTIKQVE